MHTLIKINGNQAPRRGIGEYRPAMMAIAALLGVGVTGSASAQIDWGRSAEREDRRTCQRFGAVGGKEYTRCMLEQQRRPRQRAALRGGAATQQCGSRPQQCRDGSADPLQSRSQARP
jgi:hypothetical protein